MKLVPIFADHIYAIRYKEDEKDAFAQLFEDWNDIIFLEDFFETNKEDLCSGYFGIINVETAVIKTIQLSEHLQKHFLEILASCEKNEKPDFDNFFKPLNNTDSYMMELLKSKGYNSWLRIYAIKIEANTYVITGGAIKLTQTMNTRDHLLNELTKLNRVKDWLKEQSILDNDAIIEEIYE